MKILRPREGDPGLSQGPQKFLGDRIAERISPVGGCVRGQGHWLWGQAGLGLNPSAALEQDVYLSEPQLPHMEGGGR